MQISVPSIDTQYHYQENLPNDSGSESMEMKPLVTDKINNKSMTDHIYPETKEFLW